MLPDNGNMVFITNVPPKYCPGCAYVFRWDGMARSDFFAHAAHSCPDCGAKFQYVAGPFITITASESGGDLKG